MKISHFAVARTLVIYKKRLICSLESEGAAYRSVAWPGVVRRGVARSGVARSGGIARSPQESSGVALWRRLADS